MVSFSNHKLDPHTYLSDPDKQTTHLKHVIEDIKAKYPLYEVEPGSMFRGCCVSSMKDTNTPRGASSLS